MFGGGRNVGVGDVREGDNVGRQLTLLNLLELWGFLNAWNIITVHDWLLIPNIQKLLWLDY